MKMRCWYFVGEWMRFYLCFHSICRSVCCYQTVFWLHLIELWFLKSLWSWLHPKLHILGYVLRPERDCIRPSKDGCTLFLYLWHLSWCLNRLSYCGTLYLKQAHQSKSLRNWEKMKLRMWIPLLAYQGTPLLFCYCNVLERLAMRWG